MFNSAEHIDHTRAYNQQLDRQIDRVAQEIAVQRLLEPSDLDRGANRDQVRCPAFIGAAMRWLLPSRRTQEPSGV